jgi:guanine deaminase
MRMKAAAIEEGMREMKEFALKGDIVFTSSMEEFSVHSSAYLVVEHGTVAGIYDVLPEKYKDLVVYDKGNALILPGFVDLHTHAPQFNQIGCGMDDELLSWLSEYTFPEERRFEDPDYARELYGAFVDTLAVCGTTRSVLFATIHKHGCELLVELLKNKGLSAYVGKVNMDTNAPDFLTEDTEQSLRDTEALIEHWKGGALVKPIITPRFAPTSTRRLLKGLGDIALKYRLPVQSHLSENRGEIAWIAELFPEHDAYYKVYEHYHLFGDTPTLMAHCVHLTDEEIAHLAKVDVMPVHCPDSNLNLTSGLMPARRMLNQGVRIGLGSDVGAGHAIFMPQVIVRAIQVSKMYAMQHPKDKALTLPEAFYMATKGGGQFFGKVGSFEPGYAADMLVIKTPSYKDRLSVVERLQYFIYHGDTSDISERYVAGKRIDSCEAYL